MTSYLVSRMPIASFTAEDKGNFSNRAKCAGAQFVNNAKELGSDIAIIGTAAGAGYAASKSQAVLKALAKPIEALGKLFKGTNFGDAVNSVPKPIKAAAMIALTASALLGYNTRKHAFQAGQIDQKYTDLAKLEQQGRNILD